MDGQKQFHDMYNCQPMDLFVRCYRGVPVICYLESSDTPLRPSQSDRCRLLILAHNILAYTMPVVLLGIFKINIQSTERSSQDLVPMMVKSQKTCSRSFGSKNTPGTAGDPGENQFFCKKIKIT